MVETLQHNPEAEAAVLGCLLIDNSYIKQVRENLSVEDFFIKSNGLIFRAMEWLDKKGEAIDLITITEALSQHKVLDSVGGSAYMSDLIKSDISPVSVMNYVKIVSDYSVRRKLKDITQSMSSATDESFTVDEALEAFRDKVNEVNNLGGKQNRYQVGLMADYIDASIDRYKNFGKMQGISTGFPSIDELALGLVGGELTIISGETSKGKTLLAINISNNIALSGKKILFVTLEMTHEEVTSRFMYLNDGWDTMGFSTVSRNIVFQKNDELDWKDIDGLMDNAKKQLNVDLVVIDHLHYFSLESSHTDEVLSNVMKTFKKNAIRHDVPVILISHVRKLEKDEALSNNTLKGSSSIAQVSDIVLLVNRDPETNAMGVLIDKNRNRGKRSDRTKEWEGKSERELNTVHLKFNNTKLEDPAAGIQTIMNTFPGAVQIKE